MPELTDADVAAFTDGRLTTGAETQRMLTAALVTARRYTGWPVSPVITGATINLDGPDSRMLQLPTRKLGTLTSIAEDGTLLDLSTLTWSSGGPPGAGGRPVTVRKKSRGWWSAEYQAIDVVMTHGYTETEAADWREAILTMVDQMSLVPVAAGSGASGAGLRSKRVDDVAYGWDPSYAMRAEGVLFSVEAILCDYALPRYEFL